MSDDIYCKECAGIMVQFENHMYNSFFSIPIDSWRCNKCGRVIEEKRLDKAFNWK